MSEMTFSGSTPPVTQKIIANGSQTPELSAVQKADCTDSRAIITVVRDRTHSLGKHFTHNADGTVSKASSVMLSLGVAVMSRVPTHDDLAKLLAEVGNETHAAIIPASFNGIEVGEEFIVPSAKKLEELTGIPSSDREKQRGLHPVEYNGKTMKAVCRFKENMSPSNWQPIDRDVDEYTPAEYANLTTQEYISELSQIIPDIANVTYIETLSSSSRVMLDGKPVGSGNGHIWVYVTDPAAIEAAGKALIPLAAQANMTWPKPRYSRTEEGKVIGQSLTTIIDSSVWGSGRLVFIGQPGITAGLTVAPLSPVIHQGEQNTLDISTVAMPDPETVRQATRKAGVEMTVSGSGNNVKITAEDLTLDTEIETKDHGTLTVRQIIEQAIMGKLRSQTPYRASSSYAAFYSVNDDGIPFVYDSGTGITHWLNPFQHEDAALIKANATVAKLVGTVKEDAAAVLEEEAVKALATIKQLKPAEYQRTRAVLKSANKAVSLTEVDRSVKACSIENDIVETHHGYAKSILSELTEGAWRPVGYQGELYVLNPSTGIWKALPFADLVKLVAETHDNKGNCSRSSDYKAIAEHAIALANNDTFFADAPNGLACPGGFYQIVDNKITLGPLTPEHRQRVMLGFTPTEMPTPLFDNFLHETFLSANEGEEVQQVILLQEVSGGIMLGTLHKHHIAILFIDWFGRAGKGNTEKKIRSLVPNEFISAVSPFKWDHDYHVATLAGKRLNVVGELPENEAIPASAFKTIIGGDLVTGRHPTQRPITFANEAAHLFMSNHLITTKDQSEAFFIRWKIIEFPNSRLRSGLPVIEGLAQKIIDAELPGIAYWALKGAARLLANGKLSQSDAHDRLMAKWRRNTNSLEEFIGEECVASEVGEYRRSEFYRDYTSWCADNGRKPFAKGRVKELLEHNIGLGVRLVEVNGYETFRGLGKKPARVGHAATTKAASSDTPDLSGFEYIPDETPTGDVF